MAGNIGDERVVVAESHGNERFASAIDPGADFTLEEARICLLDAEGDVDGRTDANGTEGNAVL